MLLLGTQQNRAVFLEIAENLRGDTKQLREKL